jgi:hypothetical protein
MKFKAADSFSYQRTIQPKPDLTHLYEITYYKNTAIGPIDWTIDWFHGFDKGTFVAPQRVNVNYQRVRGTSNIPIWHGGIVLSRVSKSVTSIGIRNEFKARQSSVANEGSARAALTELVLNTRNGAADWSRLNTGLKDNPDQPDVPVEPAPVSTAPYCVKDKDGHYPAQPDIALASQTGVSMIKVRSCLPLQTQAVYGALHNPLSIRWKNASKANVTSPNHIAYEKDKFLGRGAKWNMTWDYKEGSLDSQDFEVTFKIDPATKEFPVWNGSISIQEMEAGVTAVDIDNMLMTDVVSQGEAQNKEVILGLLNDLAAVASGHDLADF